MKRLEFAGSTKYAHRRAAEHGFTCDRCLHADHQLCKRPWLIGGDGCPCWCNRERHAELPARRPDGHVGRHRAAFAIPAQVVRQAAAMRAENRPWKEICDELGWSYESLRSAVRRLGR